jgi:short-subunit dehydrogenase involved in D-alanine esterification of teichoic acids
MKTTGNTILLAGGTSGIGLGLAQRFHDAGNKVIVAGRRKELLDEITSTYKGIEGEVLDITDPASILGLYESVSTKHPDLNVVVAMAGIMEPELAITPTYGATKAGLHSFTESLRHQLRDTSIQVIELAPPLTRTALMGSDNNERAMPLEDFLTETMSLLGSQQDARQILVDRVKRQRFAEATGTYDEVFAMQNGG